MEIKNFVSRGEVFMHEDGTFEIAPFQVFQLRGGLAIRIGRNCFFFNEDGSYDGPEYKPPTPIDFNDFNALRAAVQECAENRGHRPDESYFMSGCDGFDAEIQSWPSDAEVSEQEPSHCYLVVTPPTEKN